MKVEAICLIVGFGILNCCLSAAQSKKQAKGSEPAKTIRCPAEMTIVDAPQPAGGWEGHAARRKVILRGGSVIETRGGMEGDLAPTTEDVQGTAVRQEWRLGPYKDGNLLLRCYYRQTDAYVSILIPRANERCSFAFHADKKGQPVDIPEITCQ